MKNLFKLLMLFTIGIAFVGCSSLRTVSDVDKDVNLSVYKTYNFYDKGLEKIRLNNLDKRRLMAAVEAEMNVKGFTKADKPDMLVNLVVVARERADIYDSGFYGGLGWGWGMACPGPIRARGWWGGHLGRNKALSLRWRAHSISAARVGGGHFLSGRRPGTAG